MRNIEVCHSFVHGPPPLLQLTVFFNTPPHGGKRNTDIDKADMDIARRASLNASTTRNRRIE
jgi:hypothetical protein